MEKMHFGDRLTKEIQRKNSRVVVGLDPDWLKLPPSLRHSASADFGGDGLAGQTWALREFCIQIVEATRRSAVAFKPQIAFFERYGSRGIEVLERLLSEYNDEIFIVDCKRGDIGNTCEAYAQAYFHDPDAAEPAPLACDAVTHNPYLGWDSISPYMRHLKVNKGMFVLAKTSNPSSGDFQDQLIGGQPLYLEVAAKVHEWGQQCLGESGYSSIGLVAGATYPEAARQLRAVAPNAYFLVPGIGIQGGSPDDARAFANADGLGAIFAFSRGIIYAHDMEPYRTQFRESDFAKAAMQAAEDNRVQLNAALGL